MNLEKLYQKITANESREMTFERFKQAVDELITELQVKAYGIADLNPYKKPGDRNSYSDYNQGWADCVDEIITILKKTK